MDKEKIKKIAEQMGLKINFEGPAGLLNKTTGKFLPANEIFPELVQDDIIEAKVMETSQEILVSYFNPNNSYGKIETYISKGFDNESLSPTTNRNNLKEAA